MCALPNGVLMVCVLYNQMVDGGETAPTGAPTTYTQLTSAQIGTTTAEITANFPSLITTIFTNSPYINIQMANMPPGFLATLSHTYYASTNKNTAPLLTVAAKRLTAINLYSFAQAFGPTVMTPYVKEYAPATVYSAYATYLAQSAPVAIPMSQFDYDNHGYTAATMNGLSTGSGPEGMTVHSLKAQQYYAAQAELAAISPDAGYAPAALPTMAISDIWLEFYCAGTGTTVVGATIMASAYASPWLLTAWNAGTTGGTYIYNYVEQVSPGYFEDLIEYMGNLFGNYLTPTGTVTVGDPIPTDSDPYGYTDLWEDFDVCDLIEC